MFALIYTEGHGILKMEYGFHQKKSSRQPCDGYCHQGRRESKLPVKQYAIHTEKTARPSGKCSGLCLRTNAHIKVTWHSPPLYR